MSQYPDFPEFTDETSTSIQTTAFVVSTTALAGDHGITTVFITSFIGSGSSPTSTTNTLATNSPSLPTSGKVAIGIVVPIVAIILLASILLWQRRQRRLRQSRVSSTGVVELDVRRRESLHELNAGRGAAKVELDARDNVVRAELDTGGDGIRAELEASIAATSSKQD